MIYRREEPFRFQFQKPLDGTFKILRVNGIAGKSKEGNAYVYGFIGVDDQQTKTQIIHTLKEYSKKIFNKLKNQN